MNEYFTFESRILACAHCGAPIKASPSGNVVTCSYCGNANHLSAQLSFPTFAPPPPGALSEPVRLERLRAQLDRKKAPPTTLASLLDGADIPAWREKEAFAVWQAALQRASQGDLGASEELLFLTDKLCHLLEARGDGERTRAMLQSALEATTLPRHRQILASALARGALREGDLRGAESWLCLCDPCAEDLPADSAYRLSRALLECLNARPANVLDLLGDPLNGAPLAAEWRPIAQILRIHSLYASGEHQRAADLLFRANLRAEELEDAKRYGSLGFDPALVDRVRSLREARAQADAQQEAARATRQVRTARRILLGALALVVAIPTAGWAFYKYLYLPNRPFPIHLSAGEELVLEGRTAKTSGTLVDCERNCRVLIRDSNLSASVIVAVSFEGSTIEIEKSTLHAREALFRTGPGRNRLQFRDSELSSEGALGTQFPLGDVDVEARGTTLRTQAETYPGLDFHGRLVFDNSTLIAARDGIRGMGTLEILNNSDIQAGGTAVESIDGQSLIANSKVKGKAAVRLIHKAKELTVRASRIEGSFSSIENVPASRVLIDSATEVVGQRIALP